MSERVTVALVAGASLIVAAIAFGGRYSTAPVMTGPMAGGGVYVVDRFTGSVKACHFRSCRELHGETERPANQGGNLDEQLEKLFAPEKSK